MQYPFSSPWMSSCSSASYCKSASRDRACPSLLITSVVLCRNTHCWIMDRAGFGLSLMLPTPQKGSSLANVEGGAAAFFASRAAWKSVLDLSSTTNSKLTSRAPPSIAVVVVGLIFSSFFTWSLGLQSIRSHLSETVTSGTNFLAPVPTGRFCPESIDCNIKLDGSPADIETATCGQKKRAYTGRP